MLKRIIYEKDDQNYEHENGNYQQPNLKNKLRKQKRNRIIDMEVICRVIS